MEKAGGAKWVEDAVVDRGTDAFVALSSNQLDMSCLRREHNYHMVWNHIHHEIHAAFVQCICQAFQIIGSA